MNPRILSEIWIYPIKSLAGITLPSWQAMPKGLQYDRRWMLMDEHGVFMTQRTINNMAFFKTSLEGDQLKIQFAEETAYLSLDSSPKGKPLASEVWGDVVEVYEVDQHLSAWFSDKLNIRCKLVFFPEVNNRAVDQDYVLDHQVSLADGYPYLIIGEASLTDLNNRLDQKVEMNRFRPNFVFTGGNAFEEDDWKNFSIGKIDFLGVKPCSRCVLTTVDPETGIKGIEPLKTLSGYRSNNHKVLFGQNLVALNEGTIRVGDVITLK